MWHGSPLSLFLISRAEWRGGVSPVCGLPLAGEESRQGPELWLYSLGSTLPALLFRLYSVGPPIAPSARAGQAATALAAPPTPETASPAHETAPFASSVESAIATMAALQAHATLGRRADQPSIP